MQYSTCRVLPFIVTQTLVALVSVSPVAAAVKAPAKTRAKAPTKTPTKATAKTKPAVKPAPPKTSATPPKTAPQPRDLLAYLTPYNNGPGVIICEPVDVGVDEATARWGAGANRWLDFVVGSQGELGRNPPLNDEWQVSRGLKRSDMRLTEGDAAHLVRILGLTHAVTSKLTADGERLNLTLQLLSLTKDKPAVPLGDAISLQGTREQIAAELPAAARQIAERLGVKAPQVPAKLDASPAEVELLGSVPLNTEEPLDDARQAALMKLAERETLAALLALRGSEGIAKMTRLVVRRAPDNIRALSVLARQGGNQMQTFADEWQPVLKKYPQNYQVNYIRLLESYWDKNLKAKRQSAENCVRAAPNNFVTWFRLAEVFSDEADQVRQARTVGEMTETEWEKVNKSYPLWQAAAARSTTLNPQDGSAWHKLSVAATFNGDPIADKAFWTAQKLMPDSLELYWWGTQMYHPKWGGAPASMLKLADAMIANEKLGPQLFRYIVTAFDYVDLDDEHARKSLRVYVDRCVKRNDWLPPPVRDTWAEILKSPGQLDKWLKMGDVCYTASRDLIGDRVEAYLSIPETTKCKSLYGIWCLTALYAEHMAPGDSRCQVQLSKSKAFAQLSDISQQVSMVEAAIQLDPKNVEAYRWGLMIMKPSLNGDTDVLWGILKRAEANPVLFKALATDVATALGELEKTAEQKELLQKARTQIAELEKEKSEDADVQKTLGEYFQYVHEGPRALAAFKNLARLKPDSAEARSEYGYQLYSAKQDDAALAELQEALRIDKDYLPAITRTADILYYRKKDYAGAEALYRRASEINPLWVSPLMMHGEVLNTMGKRAEARAAWQSAIDLAGIYPDGYSDIELLKTYLKNNPAQ